VKFDYAAMAETATRLIDRFGQPVTLRRQIAGTFNPITGTFSGAKVEDIETVGLLRRFPTDLIDGTRILATDRQLVLVPDVVPAVGDVAVIGAENLAVEEVETVAPAGVPVVFTARVRA
jgi:hypothetical protein